MIRFFAEHPTAANLLMALFLISGLAALPRLRRETMPDFSPSEVEIRVQFPGASAEDVEEAIAQRIEDALDDISHIEEIRVDARESLCITTVEMSNNGDFQVFFNDIERAIDAIDDFPADTEKPVVQELGRTDHVLGVIISGPVDAAGLKDYSEDFKDRLQESGLPLVDIAGFSERQFRVSLSERALRRSGLSVPAVANAIASQNRDLPLGTIESRDQDILIRLTDQRRSADELKNIVVRATSSGALVRLGDIAEIADVFEIPEDRIEHHGRRAALLSIRKNKQDDSIRIAKRAKALIQAESRRHPQLSFTITQDESIILQDRLDMLLSNGVQGMLLVFLVMWAFFSARVSFWVAMGLPVSFLGAFLLAPLLGLTVNMFTMVGLLLALGLLMDDAIVIAENIATHREQGKSPLAAAIDGTREVAGGVFSSFVTTICVLGPLALITGQIGRVLRVVPMILLLVLTVSQIEAFTILPAHLHHAMARQRDNKVSRLRQKLDALFAWFRLRIIAGTTAKLIRVRYLVFSAVLALFILSVGLIVSGRLKIQGFPELEGDVLTARLLLPQGTPLARTDEIVDHILDALQRCNDAFAPKQPEQQALVKNNFVQFGLNSDAYENGPHVATITVDLLAAEIRSGSINDYIAEWQRQIGTLSDVISLSITEPGFGPAGRPIEIRLRGQDLQALKDAALAIQDWYRRFPGVFNLSDDLRRGKPELRLSLREEAHSAGIGADAIAQQLRGAFKGITADEIQVGSEAYEIAVRMADADRSSLGHLHDFMVVLPDGRQAPLRSLVTWDEGRGWARIGRFNRQRTVTVIGEIDTRLVNNNELAGLFRQQVLPDLQQRYPGVAVTFAGELTETRFARKSMLKALAMGMVGIFILLSFQFRTYTEPLIVMIAIPFSIIGIIWGHVLMGVPISMPSLLGFIAMAGVVVNDSILLVLFLKNARQEGQALPEAAVAASRDRVRAILMTSSTTIAGLLPILLERSLQAQILKPLIISTAFGLMASTVLVLFALPCFYVILGDIGWIESQASIDKHHLK